MIEIERIGLDRLADYNSIPMHTPIESRLAIYLVDGVLGGFQLVEEPVDRPWSKDHGALTEWVRRWDTSGWAFFLASLGGAPIGGATVATRTPEVSMLDRRDDLALLWDLRVHPDHQRSGVGSTLLRRVVEWSRAERMTQLKIETQDTTSPPAASTPRCAASCITPTPPRLSPSPTRCSSTGGSTSDRSAAPCLVARAVAPYKKTGSRVVKR
jgi:streptothricin acetyltransferase